MNFFLEINESNSKHKYEQVAVSIMEQVQSGELQSGDKLPSITQVSIDYDLSRNTVEKAYQILIEKKVIKAVKGKGHFVVKEKTESTKILVLFNKLSVYKKEIFNALSTAVGSHVIIDFFLYHHDYEQFEKIINEHLSGYSYYVVMPHFISCEPEKLNELLQKIEKEKIILLDKKMEGVSHFGASVYQDFEMDIYNALTSAKDSLNKYKRLTLVFPNGIDVCYPKEIIKGFEMFCQTNQFESRVINEIIADHQLKKGNAYVVIKESDLINWVTIQRTTDLVLGKDIGILSYNDTPLKSILSDGISVISTDFQQMGEITAKIINEEASISIKNDFKYIQRNSL